MWSRIATIVFLIVSINVSFTQANYNSPYSRFALGDIQNQGLGYNRAMGGLGTSFATTNRINFQNPALLQSTKHTLFDVGFETQSRTLSSDIGSSKSFDGMINYFALSFSGQEKSKKWYGGRYSMGIGLMPYAIMDYNVTSTVDIQGTTDETITLSDQGDGMINKALWINSFNIIDNNKAAGYYPTTLSLGLESSYIFGSVQRASQSSFAEDNFYNEIANEEHYRGMLLKPGLYFSQVAKVQVDTIYDKKGIVIDTLIFPTHKFNFGLTSTGSTKLNADLNQSTGYYSGTGAAMDTSSTSLNDGTQIHLNSTIRFGVSYEKTTPYRLYKKVKEVVTIDSLGNKTTTMKEVGEDRTASWKLGTDFWINDWSKYKNEFDTKSYNNTFGLAVGGEYVKNVRGLGGDTTYTSGIVYRFGVNYETLPYKLNGQSITELGINLGFGLPLSKNKLAPAKHLNVNFAYVMRGTQSAGLVQENIFKVQLSFSITDNSWFYKRPVGL